jgi:hypothetical protein
VDDRLRDPTPHIMIWLLADAGTAPYRRWVLACMFLMTVGALVNAIETPTVGRVLFAAGFPVQLAGAGLAVGPRRPWLLALGAIVTAVGASVDAVGLPTLGRGLLALGVGMLAISTVWHA